MSKDSPDPAKTAAVPPAIEVDSLLKVYHGVPAVNDVSFKVASGEVVGFLGPNGAGKSTTMRILCGLSSATAGKAFIHGVSVARFPEKTKRFIGYMPENNPLPEDLRVSEYLSFRARLKDVPAKKISERVDAVMEITDLHRTAHRRIIGALSKGFRQRVGIADALLSEPKVVVMDEPTIGLDPHQIRAFRRLLDQLRGKMTIILSSHILPEIELCCDRVIIINQGRLVAEGSPSALRKEFIPQSQWTVCLKAEPAAFDFALACLPEPPAVSSVGEADAGGFRSYNLLLKGNRPVLGEELAALFARNGWPLRQLARKEPSLEEIFMAATRRSWDSISARKTTPSAR